MARFRQVTRTIEYTEATVMAVNTATSTVENVDIELSGTYDSDEKLLKAAQSECSSDDIKYVSVIDARVSEKTFCMPESMFIQNAMPLPVGKKLLTKKDFENYYNEVLDGDEAEEAVE